jgi:phage shock protein C
MNSKTLYKSKDQAVIAGVCGGIAEYFDMDKSLVRILFVIVALFAGFPVILYIVFALVLPEKSTVVFRNTEDEYTAHDDEYEIEEDDYRL